MGGKIGREGRLSQDASLGTGSPAVLHPGEGGRVSLHPSRVPCSLHVHVWEYFATSIGQNRHRARSVSASSHLFLFYSLLLIPQDSWVLQCSTAPSKYKKQNSSRKQAILAG